MFWRANSRRRAARRHRDFAGGHWTLISTDGSLAPQAGRGDPSLNIPVTEPDQRNRPGSKAPHHRKRLAQIGHAAGTLAGRFSAGDPGIEVPTQIRLIVTATIKSAAVRSVGTRNLFILATASPYELRELVIRAPRGALRARATRLRRHASDTDVGTEHAVRTLAACAASIGPRGATRVWPLGKFLESRSVVRPGGLSAWSRVLSLGRGHERQVSRIQSATERETKRGAEHEQANNDGNPTQERHDILRTLRDHHRTFSARTTVREVTHKGGTGKQGWDDAGATRNRLNARGAMLDLASQNLTKRHPVFSGSLANVGEPKCRMK